MNSKREREIEMNECMVMSYNGVLRITWFAVRAAMMCMVASALAAAACAQTAAVVAPQFEAAGAFSYVRAKAANTGAGFDLNGGSASVAYNYRDRFAIVGDFGGYRFSGLGPGLTSTMYTYLAGPRIPLRRNRRLKPFVQVLARGAITNPLSLTYTPLELAVSRPPPAKTCTNGLSRRFRRSGIRGPARYVYIVLLSPGPNPENR